MARERLTTRDTQGNPILKSYAIDARMAAVRKLAEYEESEEKKRKNRKSTVKNTQKSEESNADNNNV